VLEIDRERGTGRDEGTVKLGRGKKKRVARTKRMQ
jgi:hypothetical protein